MCFLIEKYFPTLSTEQLRQFDKLESIYATWNAKINVISRKNNADFYIEHVLHSLGIAKVCAFKDNSTILDVGTGGGFPGIPLAILFPKVHFTLIDSIGKKILVVQSVIDQLELNNVQSQKMRAEDVKNQFDFIVSRAVTQMPKFMQWVNNKTNPTSKNELKNGILYLKGGDLQEELRPIKKPTTEYHLHRFFSEPFFDTKKVVHIAL